MKLTSDKLGTYIRDRELVKIERSSIDSNSLQAFLLGFSDHLVACRLVSDFHLEGLMFLRRSTISNITVDATSRFQRELLENAGLIDDELFVLSHRIDSYASLLTGLRHNQITIFEEESLDDSYFWIGRYVWHEDGTHCVHEFSGTGVWDDDLTELDLDALTCCQLDSNYILFYQRYFDLNGFPPIP